MIWGVQFLLFTALLADAVRSEILRASNVQICKDLCASCNGTSTFDNQICNCRIPDNDETAAECMRHVQKQQIEKLNLGSPSSQEIATRGTRCSLKSPAKSKKQVRSGDVDRVLNYFMNGGPTASVPIVGSAQAKCETSETKSSVNSKTETAPSSETKVKPATGRSASERNTVEPVLTKTKIVSSPKPSKKIDQAEDLHTIEPRSFLHHHRRFLGVLPHVLFGIPHALASAVAPVTGALYPRYSSLPQRPHLHGRSQYPHLLGAVPPLQYGLHADHAIPVHIPANDPEQMDVVPQSQLNNAYLGMLNPLLVAARTPYPHDSSLRAPQYASVLGLINPEFSNKKQDPTKMMDEEVTPLEVSKSSQSIRKSEEKPSPLHQAIIQQNAILESLSEQLHNYVPALEAPQSQGALKSIQKCYCAEQEPKVASPRDVLPQASDQFARLQGKSAESAETSPPAAEPKPAQLTLERKTTKLVGVTTNSSTEQTKENLNGTTPTSKVLRRSREPAANIQQYHWQYLPQYLNQFPENAYFTYRKKRGNVERNDKKKANIA